jgi:hypothetical protein
MAIVDEAIRWNHTNEILFNKWFPSILAYYGKCYMLNKKEGKWIVKKEQEGNVFIPHLVLSNNDDAFDVYEFYKDLYEWPHLIKEAGNWDGLQSDIRRHRK